MSSKPALPIPKLLTLLYVHNPFYLISACLFVYGLKALFRPDNMEFLFAAGTVAYIDPWWLMGSLCGVTTLMATTAYLIVRFGKVWEDARSLVLVLLLMFLAISVSFDEIIALVSFQEGRGNSAVGLMLFGGAFSIGLTEFLLRGLKIRLPWAYRLPFYGLLALFFAFPMWVCPEVSSATPEVARSRVALFPTLASAITLMLLPAVRKGAGYVRENGTPWAWPWFPWTVFVFLAGAVCFRSYSLAISFDRADARADFWDSSFGLYFLVPFVFAMLIVLLEVAITERLEALSTRVLQAAPLTLLLAYPWLGPWTEHVTYTRFAQEFIDRVGSPVYLTLWALLVFYGVGWWRGIKHSKVGVGLCCGLFTFIGPRSFSGTEIHGNGLVMQVWPLICLGILQLVTGIRRRQSVATMLGGAALCLAVGLILKDTSYRHWTVAVTFHLLLLNAVCVGIFMNDEFAKVLRTMAAWLMILAGSGSVAVVVARTLTIEVFIYGISIGSVALFAWWVCRELRLLVAAILNFSGGVLFGILRTYRMSQEMLIPAGVKPLIMAVCCFAIAVLISMLKGGLAGRLAKRLAVADIVPDVSLSVTEATVFDVEPEQRPEPESSADT